MLCCLIARRSISTTSSKLTSRPSIRLVSIQTYLKIDRGQGRSDTGGGDAGDAGGRVGGGGGGDATPIGAWAGDLRRLAF